LCLAFSAAVATLWRKILIEIPGILFLRAVLPKAPNARDALSAKAPSHAEPSERAADAPRAQPFSLRLDLVTLRAVLTNFDVGLLALLVASAADLIVEPFELPPFGTVNVRALWLAYYGLILPLDFFDYLITYMRRRHFSTEMTRLLGLAHHFRSDSYDKR
jgi:hypothetical protein